MSINIYLTGTNGGTDGILETAGDGVGVTLGAVNSLSFFFLRAANGKENAEAVTVTAPTDCQVSKNNSTYASSVVYAIGEIHDTNTPCYIKRVASTNTADGLITGIALSPRLATITERDEPTAPAAFTPTVSGQTATSAIVSFGTTDANADSLTYKVAVTQSATPPADWSGYADRTSPYTATGLTEQTDYYAHVRASDGSLTTVGTSAKFTTTAATDTTSPVLSGTLTATAQSTTEIGLNWPDATDDVGVTGYDVEYGTDETYGTPLTVTASADTITGLTAGTAYYFRVRAYDAAGNKSDWLTATTTTQFLVATTGTMSATVVGMNVVLTGVTATAGSGKTIARFEARNKLASASTWSAASTLMATWGSPSSIIAPRLLYTLQTVDIYDVQLRAVDSAGGVSAWLPATVTTAYTTLPVLDTFTSLMDGVSIDEYNGWWVSKVTANTYYGLLTRADHNGLTGAKMTNNAPVASPATSADVEARKLMGVDVSTPTYFEAKLSPVSGGSGLGIGFRVLTFLGGAVSINYAGSSLTCYNGTSWATLKTGLSGNITLRVVPIYNTKTATVYVNGESLGTVDVWRTFAGPVTGIQLVQTGAGLNTATTVGVDDVAIGLVS